MDTVKEFHYNPFAVKLDRCVGGYCVGNTLNCLSNKVCIPNKTEDLNLSVFTVISGTNEAKTLTKQYYANVNVNLMEQNVIQINDGITINVDASVKNIIYVRKNMFGILVHVIVKIENI